MKKKLIIITMTFVMLTFLFTGCGAKEKVVIEDKTPSKEKVELELFSNKSENKITLEELIVKFEQENPDIKIKLNAPPESETVLKMRLAKDDMPDMISLGGNSTYGELAREGMLIDLSENKDLVGKAQSAYLNMLGKVVGKNTEGIFAIPYATNANGIIFNKDKFEKLNVSIPKTWDELIATVAKIKEAGEVPFYLTYKDAWTTLIPWNSLAANLQGDDFIDKRVANEITFKDRYGEVVDKMFQLLNYGHSDNMGVGYSDGNAAFAQGKSVMYIQGNWAIAEILKANPDANLGYFAFPASNTANNNKLVSGVDMLLAVSSKTMYKEEAIKFIEFMIREENAQKYIKDQFALSAINNIYQEETIMENIKVNFENGTITGFPDHYFPAGMDLATIIQEGILNNDKAQFLDALDIEWDKAQQQQ